jgi:hypothetical protein
MSHLNSDVAADFALLLVAGSRWGVSRGEWYCRGSGCHDRLRRGSGLTVAKDSPGKTEELSSLRIEVSSEYLVGGILVGRGPIFMLQP